MTPRVYSRRKRAQRPPAGAVLVDRTTPYGNPFEIGRDGTRDEVCDKFRAWANAPEQAELRERARRELRGKDLVCWCKDRPTDPTRCHAETWLEIANGEPA